MILPARTGTAVSLQAGQTLRVVNTHGTQVVDTWAFVCDAAGSANPRHHMSQSHTRARLNRFSPRVGDRLYTNRRRPILQLVEDTSAGADGVGVHDTVIAACDIWRYRELTGRGDDDDDDDDDYYHESCAENLAKALQAELGEGVDVAGLAGWGNGPDPLNLWMNIPIHLKTPGGGSESSPSAGTSLSFEKPVCKAGDYVRLKNVSSGRVVVVMSACPQDLLDINCRAPTSVEYVVEDDA